jgi:hypothetical protein
MVLTEIISMPRKSVKFQMFDSAEFQMLNSAELCVDYNAEAAPHHFERANNSPAFLEPEPLNMMRLCSTAFLTLSDCFSNAVKK